MISIKDNTFKTILLNHFNNPNKLPTGHDITEHIVGIMLDNLDTISKQHIFDIMFSNKVYTPPTLNAYFKINHKHDKITYDLLDKLNLDILKDMGLFDGECIYGIIKDSKNYDSKFKPYYSSFSTDVFVHDDEFKPKRKEINFEITDIQIINDEEIKDTVDNLNIL